MVEEEISENNAPFLYKSSLVITLILVIYFFSLGNSMFYVEEIISALIPGGLAILETIKIFNKGKNKALLIASWSIIISASLMLIGEMGYSSDQLPLIGIGIAYIANIIGLCMKKEA